MNRWRQRLKRGLIKYMALPQDIILELPRITMIGQIHIYVENHQGLEVFSENELKLKAPKGYIQITGTSFVLKMMYPAEVLLEGTISDVKFVPD